MEYEELLGKYKEFKDEIDLLIRSNEQSKETIQKLNKELPDLDGKIMSIYNSSNIRNTIKSIYSQSQKSIYSQKSKIEESIKENENRINELENLIVKVAEICKENVEELESKKKEETNEVQRQETYNFEKGKEIRVIEDEVAKLSIELAQIDYYLSAGLYSKKSLSRKAEINKQIDLLNKQLKEMKSLIGESSYTGKLKETNDLIDKYNKLISDCNSIVMKNMPLAQVQPLTLDSLLDRFSEKKTNDESMNNQEYDETVNILNSDVKSSLESEDEIEVFKPFDILNQDNKHTDEKIDDMFKMDFLDSDEFDETEDRDVIDDQVLGLNNDDIDKRLADLGYTVDAPKTEESSEEKSVVDDQVLGLNNDDIDRELSDLGYNVNVSKTKDSSQGKIDSDEDKKKQNGAYDYSNLYNSVPNKFTDEELSKLTKEEFIKLVKELANAVPEEEYKNYDLNNVGLGEFRVIDGKVYFLTNNSEKYELKDLFSKEVSYLIITDTKQKLDQFVEKYIRKVKVATQEISGAIVEPAKQAIERKIKRKTSKENFINNRRKGFKFLSTLFQKKGNKVSNNSEIDENIILCPNCGCKNQSDDTYCNSCGYSFNLENENTHGRSM